VKAEAIKGARNLRLSFRNEHNKREDGGGYRTERGSAGSWDEVRAIVIGTDTSDVKPGQYYGTAFTKD
jgi:hypothetical protein